MLTSIRIPLIAIVATAALATAAYEITSPKAIATVKENKSPSAFGFYAGMTEEQFVQTIAAVKKNNPDLFVKWVTALSPDEKTVPAIGLVFPTAKFKEVITEVTKNGNVTCQKNADGNMFCNLKSENGDRIDVIAYIFDDKKTGDMYGAISITDKDHSDPKHSTIDSKKEKLTGGDFSDSDKATVSCPAGQRPLHGNCVTDL